jgi:tRNA-modifying protein YgfZ
MTPPDAGPAADSSGAPVWAPLGKHRVFEVTGRDARDFLHRMLTQDVKGIPVGSGRAALLLTVRGRVVGDPFVWNLGDRFAMTLAPRAAEATIPALERYVIADDVAFADATDAWTTGLYLPGAGAEAVAALGGGTLHLAPRPFGSGAATAVLARPDDAVALERALRVAKAVEVEGPTFHALRVEAGVPWFGAEIDDRILPNEAGLDASISWTKGCYPGQEPVVMAKHRGHPPSRLVRFEGEGRQVPVRDVPLWDGGRDVGRVTTAVRSADGARVRGMGFVRWDLALAGRTFGLENGRVANVLDLLA